MYNASLGISVDEWNRAKIVQMILNKETEKALQDLSSIYKISPPEITVGTIKKGKISAQNNPGGKGATFSFILPITQLLIHSNALLDFKPDFYDLMLVDVNKVHHFYS